MIQKIQNFLRLLRKNEGKINKIPRSIAINFNNKCNFKCDFCYSAESEYSNLTEYLSLDRIRKLSEEAHQLGIWEIVLQGGELLIDKGKLFNLIEALDPEKFQIVLVTNGWFINEKVALQLKEAKVDCVAISISSMNEEEHDKERHMPGAHKRALNALAECKKVGISTWPNVIFGHHNAFSQDLIDLLEYAKANDYSTYFLLAAPYGCYKDSLMTAEDIERLNWIRKNYNCFFDTWDMYDSKKEKISGCWTVNRTYITPNGDVFPCSFLPIKIGNIYQESFLNI